ncbi:MAG: outer membrane beta-barrel protein, partial [Rikenellaceae bacterium]
ENDTETDRQYFDSTDGISSYWQNKDTSMDNYNHRFNGRIEYKIDDNNELVITPKFSFQDNTSISILDGISYLDGDATDYVTNNSISDVVKYNLSTDVTFRHKFKKRGRTMSIFMGGTLTNSQTETTSEISTTSTTEEENQFKDALSDKISLRGNVMFTENLFKYLQLSLTYRLSYTNTDADQKTFIQDKLSDLYDQIDSDQSSVYTSDYITQSGGIGLRFFKYGFSAMISADLQNASLVGDQSYPSIGSTDKNFTSLLPSMFVRYTLDRSNSFMFRYRSNTSSPDMDDLLDVIDESNPLFLTQGNPDLEQQTSHAVNIRYIRTSMAGTTFIAMLGGTIYDQYVGDNISILDDGVQLTKPINLDGYYSAQAMLTYGFPVGFMKSNINLSASANYSNTPYLYNDEEYTTRDLTLTPKVVIGSNISDKLDFTMSYSAAVNKALNSDEDSTSSDYISHSATGKLGWEFFNGFVVSSSLSYTGYSGISDTDDVEYYLLSAAITKRFLKNRAARIKVEATDILGQNQSFRSSVGSNYFEYTTSNVLESYVMVSFSYTFR